MGTAAFSSTPTVFASATLALALTLLSGMGDALGFVYAARIWQHDSVHWPSLGRSGGGFALGMTMQWMALRYQHRIGIDVAEMQAAVCFTVTVIGIAVLSRAAQSWAMADRLVAVAVMCGLGWLIVRTGG
jgi:hypothetical protein